MDQYNSKKIEYTIESQTSLSNLNLWEDYAYQNVITGDSRFLYYQLIMSILSSDRIDIIVSFLMESGVRLILDDLKAALKRGAKLRILTGNYLGITQPSALFLLKKELGDQVDLRLYSNPNKSFHPKSYIFHQKNNGEIYIGSSNLSYGALTSSIEWNYRFTKSSNGEDFNGFYKAFKDLFYNHSYVVTDKVLIDYSKNWKKPYVSKDFERYEKQQHKAVNIFRPKGAQIEALYLLEKSRAEGFDKGIIVAATGVGKTYLAAFDSEQYKKILYVAHREEILRQAAQSFYNIRKSDNYGFFTGKQKDTGKAVIFALVQSIGKEKYLRSDLFDQEYFDYIIIDEFHHAVANNYLNIINYFKPKFMLGLTATPERLDSKNVFALCDYNIVYEVRLKECINKGWLVPFHYYGIYDETVNYENIRYLNGKYHEKDLEKALMLNRRRELIFKHYSKYSSNKALGFCSSKLHAEYMAREFNHFGIPSAAVYSGCQGKYSMDRRTAVESLIKGELKVIFSVDMFNEGLDIKDIDMVMFLRPTQSPTVFLQQLGRGLRKCKGKDYLNVLDFIGNYRRANLIPSFLSNEPMNLTKYKGYKITDFEYPDECIVDFDFRIVDIFEKQAKQELSIKNRIINEYKRIKGEIGHIPSRMEFFAQIDSDLYDSIKTKRKLNVFANYLDFLKEMNDLTEQEKILCSSRGKEFINMIENTSMSKTYKMPLLLAFYNNGNIKMQIFEEDVYQCFYEFYHRGSNKVDMLRSKSTRSFENWDKRKYIKLAKDNPIHFMLQSHGDFFVKKEGPLLALAEDLQEVIHLSAFKKHMKDAIDYRVMSYYRNRSFITK
ncbi:MAG TPA: DEAD/DEAH box helicase family protein [Clostridiales bacterium]|nr:DEAD/DEAH box helicase family protein [Clostridiales bacterium]